jgi:hypothetical protein
MRVTCVCALFLSACGAHNQSAVPFPPTFEPEADAPITIGHPGYVAPEPERSPHKRVLPETPDTRREPGIWAARDDLPDGGPLPKANPTWPNPPVFLSVPLPYTPVTGTDEDRYYARKCAWLLTAFQPHVAVDVSGLNPYQRRCLVARAYSACMATIEQPSVSKNEYFMMHINATRKRAKDFEKEACEEEALAPETDAFLRGLRMHLMRNP